MCKRFHKLVLLSALILAFPATVMGQQITPPIPGYTANYDLKKSGITIGKTKRKLRYNDNGLHIFESVTEAAGLAKLFYSGELTERSEWQYVDSHVRPVNYRYQDTSKTKPRDVQLSFDWSTRRVTNTINGDPWKMDLLPRTQDKLGYQIQLMLDLRKRPEKLVYNIADGGKLKEYEVDVLAPEQIETELGRLEIIPVRLIHGKRTITFLCATTLHYLPVRIEQHRKGKLLMTAEIQSVSGITQE